MHSRILISIFIFFYFTSNSFSLPYEKLREDYFLLKNRDYKLEENLKWEKLINKYEIWIKKANKNKEKNIEKLELASFH